MSKIHIKTIFFVVFICIIFTQISAANVKELNKRQNKAVLISMGIQNLPDIYYDHYFAFPGSIEELCSFFENHYDYKNNSEISSQAIKYLKENKKKIKVIANKSMFFICDGNNFSYNNKDICSIIATHNPETEYIQKRMEVQFFDSNDRNIQEIKGFDFVESLRIEFVNYIKEVINTNDSIFILSKNKRFAFDQYERIILEYTTSNGIDTYCQNETINNFNSKYLFELNKLCGEFCEKFKLNRILFVSLIIY